MLSDFSIFLILAPHIDEGEFGYIVIKDCAKNQVLAGFPARKIKNID